MKLIKDFVSDPANENELVPATLARFDQGQREPIALSVHIMTDSQTY